MPAMAKIIQRPGSRRTAALQTSWEVTLRRSRRAPSLSESSPTVAPKLSRRCPEVLRTLFKRCSGSRASAQFRRFLASFAHVLAKCGQIWLDSDQTPGNNDGVGRIPADFGRFGQNSAQIGQAFLKSAKRGPNLANNESCRQKGRSRAHARASGRCSLEAAAEVWVRRAQSPIGRPPPFR